MTELTDKQAQLASLKKVRASGALQVRHGEISTTYRSMEEINKAIAILEGEIAGLQDTSTAPRRVHYLYQSGKGL